MKKIIERKYEMVVGIEVVALRNMLKEPYGEVEH